MSGTIQAPDTATRSASTGNLQVSPVAYGYYPKEGSRCVSLAYAWTSQTGFAEDLSGLVARGVETTIQSIFVDNSASNVSASILVAGSGQLIVIPPLAQGLFPIFFTGIPSFQITVPNTQAGSLTRLILLNVPTASCGLWSAATGTTITIPALTAVVLSLPTTLPGVAGVLWLNGGVLSIS